MVLVPLAVLPLSMVKQQLVVIILLKYVKCVNTRLVTNLVKRTYNIGGIFMDDYTKKLKADLIDVLKQYGIPYIDLEADNTKWNVKDFEGVVTSNNPANDVTANNTES
jgi:tryptophan synthase alpha subunit